MGCFCSKKREVPREIEWKSQLDTIRSPLTDMLGYVVILRDKGTEPYLVGEIGDRLEETVVAVNELGCKMQEEITKYHEPSPKKEWCKCLKIEE